MKLFLEKMFDIRTGEYRRALLMQAYIFLIIFTLLIVKPTANSLFLSRFGVESLPYAFILVAILAAVISSLYARWLNKISLYKIIHSTLKGCILSLLAFGIFLQLHLFGGVILYLFYLWVMIFAVLTTSQFWVLANMVFNPREAKRLFGFIGSGAIAGGILGGYAASLLAQITSSENLLFLGAFCLLFCFPILNRIWKYSLNKQNLQQEKTEGLSAKKHPLTLILESKHLTYLAGIVGVGVMVAKLIDYQFSGIAAAHYPDKDELTTFFGFWFSTFNVLSLVLQLFLTKRIMENISVSRSLLLLPILILVATTAMIIMPEVLFIVIALKMTDGSLKQSINKSAMELMVLPIPIKIKNSAKTFIDVFVDSLATGISGILLIFVVKGLALPTIAISGIILFITLIWLFLIIKIRKEYLHSFRLKIENVPSLPTDIQQINTNPDTPRSLRKWFYLLEKGTEKQIITALQKIKQISPKQGITRIKKLLGHQSPEIKIAAIETIQAIDKQPLLEEMEWLIDDDDDLKVQIRALDYLLCNDLEHRVQNIEFYLENEHYQLRGTALVGLATEAIIQPDLRKEFRLDARLFDWYNAIAVVEDSKEKVFRKVTFLKAIGRGKLEEYYGHIHKGLQHNHPVIVQQAILSAGHTEKEVYLNILASFLQQKLYRAKAQKALRLYQEKAFPLYIEMIKNPLTSLPIIRALPNIIKKIHIQQSVDILLKLLDHQDLTVRQEALRGLNRLRHGQVALKFGADDLLKRILQETQFFQFTITAIYTQRRQMFQDDKTKDEAFKLRYDARKQLLQLLESRLQNNLERIFLLLGLKYPPADVMSIYRGIRCSKADLQVNALEFLDNLLGMNLKKIIIPIIETALLEQITEEKLQHLNLTVPNEYECLERLTKVKDKRLRLATKQLLGVLEEQVYIDLLATLPKEVVIKAA